MKNIDEDFKIWALITCAVALYVVFAVFFGAPLMDMTLRFWGIIN